MSISHDGGHGVQEGNGTWERRAGELTADDVERMQRGVRRGLEEEIHVRFLNSTANTARNGAVGFRIPL